MRMKTETNPEKMLPVADNFSMNYSQDRLNRMELSAEVKHLETNVFPTSTHVSIDTYLEDVMSMANSSPYMPQQQRPSRRNASVRKWQPTIIRAKSPIHKYHFLQVKKNVPSLKQNLSAQEIKVLRDVSSEQEISMRAKIQNKFPIRERSDPWFDHVEDAKNRALRSINIRRMKSSKLKVFRDRTR